MADTLPTWAEMYADMCAERTRWWGLYWEACAERDVAQVEVARLEARLQGTEGALELCQLSLSLEKKSRTRLLEGWLASIRGEPYEL